MSKLRTSAVLRWFSPALALVVAGDAFAEDWPKFGGPRGDNTSLESGLVRAFPKDGPTVLWSTELGEGYGGAAVAGDEVYVLDRGDNQDVLRCFDLKDGRELWTFEYEAPGRLNFPGSRGVPWVGDEYLYTIGGFGHVHCIDRKAHDCVWSVNLKDEYQGEMPQWGWSQSPILHEDVIIAAPLGDEAGLVALDAESGKEVWRTEGLGTTHSSPVLVDIAGVPQVLFITFKGDKGMLSSFAAKDGKLLWRSHDYVNSIPIPYPVKVDDQRVFVTGGYKSGSVMLEVKNSGEKFGVKLLTRIPRGSQIHLPIRVKDHLYFLANENETDHRTKQKEGGLMCMALDGSEVWRTGDSPYFGRGNMLHADGMLILQDGSSGHLRLLEPRPEGFKLLAEANIFESKDGRDQKMWAPMALSGGRLLMRSQNTMKCVELKKSTASAGSSP